MQSMVEWHSRRLAASRSQDEPRVPLPHLRWVPSPFRGGYSSSLSGVSASSSSSGAIVARASTSLRPWA